MKRILILIIAIFCFQNFAFAKGINCTTKGNTTTCSAGNYVLTTITTKALPSGYVEVRTCNKLYCESQLMTPLAAQGYVNEIKGYLKLLETAAAQQAQQRQQYENNKNTIIKKVEIVTKQGTKISLEEDKNNDDYLVINGKRTKFSSYLATKTLNDVEMRTRGGYSVQIDTSQQMGDNIDIEKLICENQKMDKLQNKKRSVVQIIEDSRNLCELFKVVYKLRYDYNISFKDAKKLMTFGLDNGNYKPQHLLLPKEIAQIKYETLMKLTEESFKDIVFPVIKANN
ncbi:MAG: hypothetical protein NC311_15005 [Muribaculaceae bacterium]|nr:hypothetical protein [Muribaculaceae bacterium]